MTLRLRILVGVAVTIAGCLALAFGAIYRGTNSNLLHSIDADLRGDASAFSQSVTASDDPYAAARSYVADQPFRATTRLLFAVVAGHAVVSNEPELLHRRDPQEPGGVTPIEAQLAHDVLTAPVGFSTQHYPDVGDLRLLVRVDDGVRFGAGEPLESLQRTRRGIERAFVVAAALALAVALLAAAGLSVALTRRLRRMAALADRVDAGDLAPRMGSGGPRDEVHHLAVAFDTMLDRLQDAFDRQTAFVADASHELRTPLTIIRGQLEVLAREQAPSPQDVRRAEQLVRTEVQRMNRMVDDLLVLAAPIEHPRATHLRPLLTELLDGMRATADRRFKLGEITTITVRADRERLTQALRNLVRNAIDHTRPGGVVRLSATPGDGVVRLAVDDDGAGIPAGELRRVFDRFHRVSGERRVAGTGVGLGLAIVQAIAEAHGGRAFAEPSELGGARVVIELPR